MIKNKIKIIITLQVLTFLTPVIVFAQGTVREVLYSINNVLNATVPIILGLAILLFLWGLLKFLTTPSADERKEAKSFMLYGIIALFVMVSLWGLVAMVAYSFPDLFTQKTTLVPTYDVEILIPGE